MSTGTTARRAGRGRQRREIARGAQGLTAREKAALTAIEDWYRHNPGKERTMDKKTLTPLAKDAYNYGAEQGFRLGYLAAGEVVAAATREHHRSAGEYLRDELRRRFDEAAARCMAEAPGE